MLETALLRLGPVRLDGGHQVGRIEAGGEPAPPRLDDRRPHPRRRLGWKLGTELALAEEPVPAPLNLPGAREQVGSRFDGLPLRGHRQPDHTPGTTFRRALACAILPR